jgi:CRISPR-associated protein Csb1
MSDDLVTSYDHWIRDDNGPAALVIREHLMAVEGHDGVLFPATFAASEDKKFPGGYNVDKFPDGKNICLIDSVGSQANRIEPLFAKGEYAGLVPRIVVKAGQNSVNLLDAGHRAGDALVRCSELQQVLQDAFKAVQKGDVEPLAKIAPTSIVFGAWDSRDTQAKLPRLIASTIRAFDIRELTRSAVYVPPLDHVEAGNIPEYANDKEKEKYSGRGWLHALASATHGGIVAAGGVRRDASLQVAALRLLAAGGDEAKTLAVRRYVLGLALTAFTYRPAGYLRQGCNLVLDPEKPRELHEIYADGRRKPTSVTHSDALSYAKAAAKAFGIGADREVQFDKDLAKKDLAGDVGDGAKASRKSDTRKAK